MTIFLPNIRKVQSPGKLHKSEIEKGRAVYAILAISTKTRQNCDQAGTKGKQSMDTMEK